MDWRDLVAGWDANPEFQKVYAENYPHHVVADAVVELRASLGLSQAELAEKVGTTQSVIARLESGRHAVRVDLIDRIADAVEMVWRPVFVAKERKVVKTVNALPDVFGDLRAYGHIDTHIMGVQTTQVVIGEHYWSEVGEPLSRAAHKPKVSGFITSKGDIWFAETEPEVQRPAGNRQSTLALAG